MKSLGKLLRAHIAESGYTIYKAAGSAGINRTTLQKILTDERSASEELLHKLIPILKLSPDEEAEVWRLYEISRIGEAIYKQRQCIKNMIESIASLDRFFYPEGADTSRTGFISQPASQAEYLGFDAYSLSPVQGIHSVEQLICAFFERECEPTTSCGPDRSRIAFPLSQDLIPSLPHPTAEILINAPGNLPALKQLFIHQIPHSPRRSKIELKHITPLLKASGQSGLMLTNMEILSDILPFTISQAFHYEVYCFYRKELLLDSPHYGFPYYIVFSCGVILLSCDGHTALPLGAAEAIAYFRNLFYASMKKAIPLINTCTNPEEILQSMLTIDCEPRPFRTLEHQPCFATYLTESMLRKYISPVIKNEELIHSLRRRICQLASMEKHSCIFSRDGLVELAVEGRISDFPSQYMHPINISDRILLLKALYLACKEDKQFLRLVNPVTLSLPRHLNFILRDEYSIDFSGYPSCGTGYNYIHLTEPGILESFQDFYNYLSNSNLVCTKEETLSEIEALIVSLTSAIYPPPPLILINYFLLSGAMAAHKYSKSDSCKTKADRTYSPACLC